MSEDKRVTEVRRGSFLNAEQIVCAVRIMRVELTPADEHAEAPPGQHGVFCIEWGTPQGKFTSGLFGFATVAAASQHVERSAKAVSWRD